MSTESQLDVKVALSVIFEHWVADSGGSLTFSS